MYMTEVPNYFLPNAVHVPRIKFFTSSKICLLLLLCQKYEDVLCTLKIWLWRFHLQHANSLVFCTQKDLKLYLQKSKVSFSCLFPNRISNRLYCKFHIIFENELNFEPLYSRSSNNVIFGFGEKLH